MQGSALYIAADTTAPRYAFRPVTLSISLKGKGNLIANPTSMKDGDMFQ
jgi:hypothetical protein